MKLASVALVLGGAVFGSQLGDGRVHEELRTKSLVIQGAGGDVVFTPSFGGGLSIQLGRGSKYGGAQVELGVDAGGWKLELRNEHGASVRARVVEETAELIVAGAPDRARLSLYSNASPMQGGGDQAHIAVLAGAREAGQGSVQAVRLAVRHGSGQLSVLHSVETDIEAVDGVSLTLWETLMRVSEGSSTGPWETSK